MKKSLLFILCTVVALKCYAKVDFDYCLENIPPPKNKTEEKSIFVIKKLMSATNFKELNDLQKYGDDGFNSITVLIGVMSSANVSETAILEVATMRYQLSHYLTKKQRVKTLNNFLDGRYYGFDGSLLSLLLSTPQASFLLYDDSLEKQNNNTQSVNTEETKSRESKLFNLLINDEESIYFKGNNKATHEQIKDIPIYSAIEIANTYNENEVKGDLKFKRKLFSVYGIVDAVKSSIDDKPIILFDTHSATQQTTAFFNEQVSLDKIAEIKKRTQLNLVCVGGGEVSGSPLLSECVFFDDYLRGVFFDIGSNSKLSPIYDIKNLSLAVKLISSLLPKDSACFGNDVMKCKIDIFNIPEKTMRTAAIKYGLNRGIVKSNIRVIIDEFNKKISSNPRYNKDDLEVYIKRNEACFVPAILKSF